MHLMPISLFITTMKFTYATLLLTGIASVVAQNNNSSGLDVNNHGVSIGGNGGASVTVNGNGLNATDSNGHGVTINGNGANVSSGSKLTLGNGLLAVVLAAGILNGY